VYTTFSLKDTIGSPLVDFIIDYYRYVGSNKGPPSLTPMWPRHLPHTHRHHFNTLYKCVAPTRPHIKIPLNAAFHHTPTDTQFNTHLWGLHIRESRQCVFPNKALRILYTRVHSPTFTSDSIGRKCTPNKGSLSPVSQCYFTFNVPPDSI
jgi:hypothetical protein